MLFALIFKFIPHAHTGWTAVWIGATLTACLFDIGKVASCVRRIQVQGRAVEKLAVRRDQPVRSPRK